MQMSWNAKMPWNAKCLGTQNKLVVLLVCIRHNSADSLPIPKVC